MFCYDNNLFYPVYISNENFESCMDLLIMSILFLFHYVYMKSLADLCAIRQKIKIKNTFASIICNVLVVKEFW